MDGACRVVFSLVYCIYHVFRVFDIWLWLQCASAEVKFITRKRTRRHTRRSRTRESQQPHLSVTAVVENYTPRRKIYFFQTNGNFFLFFFLFISLFLMIRSLFFFLFFSGILGINFCQSFSEVQEHCEAALDRRTTEIANVYV